MIFKLVQMKNKNFLNNLNIIISDLKNQKVIAYPTESVFGLGCDPDSEIAVKNILKIKKRSWKKGFIIVASEYKQVRKYIDQDIFNNIDKKKIFSRWPGPTTWLLPANINTPKWLTGNSNSLAVRISAFRIIRIICSSFGKAIISTSANLSIQNPARTAKEVRDKLGNKFNILDEKVEGKDHPCEIIDAISGKFIRMG